LQLAAEAFMQRSRQVAVTVADGGTQRGLRAVIDGTEDVAMASSALDAIALAQAARRGLRLASHVVAYDALVPLVHGGLGIQSVGLPQLRSIYGGAIVNWREVGGPLRPIVVLGEALGSDLREAWQELVPGDAATTPKERLMVGGLEALVARTPGAIGYGAQTERHPGVTALAVDGVRVSTQTLRSGAYALRRPLSLVTRDPATSVVADFISFMLDPQAGQRILGDARHVAAI
jgi:phosphate transport system substrate-binding protein